MSAVEALSLARKNGIRIGVSGTDLVLDAEREPPPVVLEAIRRNKAAIVALFAADSQSWSAVDWQAFFESRAGAAEVDGRTREQAEAVAFDACVVEWLNRNPCRSNPDRCAACGGPDREGHAIVPFGTENHGHTWLHPGCWKEWHRSRRKRAETFLLSFVRTRFDPSDNAKFPDDFGKNGGA